MEIRNLNNKIKIVTFDELITVDYIQEENYTAVANTVLYRTSCWVSIVFILIFEYTISIENRNLYKLLYGTHSYENCGGCGGPAAVVGPHGRSSCDPRLMWVGTAPGIEMSSWLNKNVIIYKFKHNNTFIIHSFNTQRCQSSFKSTNLCLRVSRFDLLGLP